MAEIYVGSNFPARTTIFYAGELYVSEGPVNVQVYDITQDPAVVPSINPETLVIVVGKFILTALFIVTSLYIVLLSM